MSPDVEALIANPAEMEQRIHQFRHLRQRDYDRLLKSVQNIIFNERMAEEAFAHAMVVAAEHFDGRASLKTFVLRVARNYAINESKRRQREDLFTELDIEGDGEQIEHLGSSEDTYDLGFHAEEFARRVAALLKATASDTLLTSPLERTHARRAAIVFDTLVESAKENKGLGIDEYEDDDCFSPSGKANPRTEFEERVAALLSQSEGRPLKRKTTEEVTTYLRRHIRKVLEGIPT